MKFLCGTVWDSFSLVCPPDDSLLRYSNLRILYSFTFLVAFLVVVSGNLQLPEKRGGRVFLQSFFMFEDLGSLPAFKKT